MDNDLKIYTDASFDEKIGVAGIGILIKKGQKERIYSGYIKARTVNDAELFAIHLASIMAEGKGIIYTDSQTAISYIKREIKDKPRTREQYFNHMQCEYWAAQIRRRKVNVEKIKAHEHKFQTHSIGNRIADLLAMRGRASFYEK